MITIINDFKQKIAILTKRQRDFLSLDRREMQAENFDYFRLNKEEKDDETYPSTFILRWSPSLPAKVLISENKEFSNCTSLFGVGECQITNLKSDTLYFTKVVAENDTSEIASFTTEASPIRFLKVDGVMNVRDSGGRKTKDGLRIKQGMLYRGTEMNSHVIITQEGLSTMKNVLKIQTVLDLRGSGEIIENVYKKNYKNIPCCAYAPFLSQKDEVCEIFKMLSDESNYPIYYHCWGGADRPGTLAFLIGAILGEEESALLDDYEITSLCVWGIRSRNLPLFRDFLQKLNEFEGENLTRKTENCLLTLGVTNDQLQKLKNIMIEKPI